MRSSRRPCSLYTCETLEPRQLLAGTWAALSNSLPNFDGAEVMLQLSDGSVMVHGGAGDASGAWYKLTPTNGNYQNGTFSQLASMATQRLFFGSVVLSSGKVLVVGGEYSGPNTTGNFTNTAEIYDPVANTWSAAATFPKPNFGDDQLEVLPNGTVLGGYISGPQTYIYNPATNAWTASGTKLRNDRSDEEGWIKLPDDSLLSYDVFATLSKGTPSAQRYIPSTGQWIDAGTPTASLSDSDDGDELGPGILLPDQRAMYFGANGNTEFYSLSTNSWSAGPAIPNELTASDDPAAMLPNGHVLVAVSPEETNENFPGPTTIYEYDPVANTYTNVTPNVSGFSLAENAFTMNMLVLPTGQVLLANDSGEIAIYTPTGSPSASWRPAITNITYAAANTFTLTGTTLNGISEGAEYGDDAQMSSNYPIVQLIDSAGDIFYARTVNWTNTGVAMGTVSSVTFTLPAGISPGPFLVTTIANGIASPTILNVQTTGSTTTLQAGAGASTTAVVINGATVGTFAMSSFSGVIVTGDTSANTININQNFGTDRITINGAAGDDIINLNANSAATIINGDDGNDTINIAAASNNLSSDTGAITVNGGAGNDAIVMADLSNTTASAYTLAGGVVSRSGVGGLTYGGDVENLSVTTGSAADSVAVTSLPAGTAVTLNSAGGADVVTVGASAVGVQGILAPLSILDTASSTALTIDDTGDTTARVATLAAGTLTSLAPAAISWSSSITSLSVVGGSGNDTLAVAGTRPATVTQLSGGAGTDTLNITSTDPASPLIVAPSTGDDAINVTPAGGNTAAIVFNTTQRVGPVILASGAAASLAKGASVVLTVTSLSLDPASKFDVADNALIWDYTDASPQITIRTDLAAGFNAGTWTGPQLTSSSAAADPTQTHALGYAQTSDLGISTFRGQPVDSTAVVVAYTKYGDNNLDGKVDTGNDFTLFLDGLAARGSTWFQGDYTYDGKVDLCNDFNLLDRALLS